MSDINNDHYSKSSTMAHRQLDHRMECLTSTMTTTQSLRPWPTGNLTIEWNQEKREELTSGLEKTQTIPGIGGLDDLDDDIGGAEQLGGAGVERDLDGIKHVELSQSRGGYTCGAEQVLHGRGDVEQFDDLPLDELIPGLGVALDDHFVDVDAHLLRRQSLEIDLDLLLLYRGDLGPIPLLLLFLIVLVVVLLRDPGFRFGFVRGLAGLGLLRVLVGGRVAAAGAMMGSRKGRAVLLV
jgi:hypothetical protein